MDIRSHWFAVRMDSKFVESYGDSIITVRFTDYENPTPYGDNMGTMTCRNRVHLCITPPCTQEKFSLPAKDWWQR